MILVHMLFYVLQFIFVLHVLYFMYCFFLFTLHINIINACLVLHLHYIIVFVLHLYSFVACNSLWSVCCVFCAGRLGE